MRKLLRKMAVFSEFSFWFYRTRIPAQDINSQFTWTISFELKIYLCENIRMRLVKTAIELVEISL